MCDLWKIVCYGNCTKTVRKGPKQKAKSVNDHCRICKCSFKVQFGNSNARQRICSSRLKNKESKGSILANACGLLGLRVVKCPDLSERVCRPCGRKISNAVENISFIKQNLVYPDLKSVADSSRSSPPRQKRLLPTTVTPERSSTKIKKAKVRRKLQGTSSKQFFKEQNGKGKINNLLKCGIM